MKEQECTLEEEEVKTGNIDNFFEKLFCKAEK